MYKLTRLFDPLSPTDVGVGPSRFARFDNERPSPGEQPVGVGIIAVPNIADRVWSVAADIMVQRLRVDSQSFLPHLSDDNDDDPFKEKEPKQRAGGGCSDSTCKKEDIFKDLQTVSEKTGGNVSAVAQEAAELGVSHRQEFLRGITIHHARYKKEENGKWDNKGRDILDLVDPDKPGGERRPWYQALKDGMGDAAVGIIISPPTVYDELNYVQVYKNNGADIDLYSIEHRGNTDDLNNLYTVLAGEDAEVDFSKPIFSKKDISFEQIADTIEQSFVTEESKAQSRDYLERLRRDVANVHLIDDYQKEAAELAKKIEQELLSRQDLQQGMAAIVWGLAAYANGEISEVMPQSQDVVRSTIREGQHVVGQIIEDTREIGEAIIASIQHKVIEDDVVEGEKLEAKNHVEQQRVLVHLLDGNYGEKTLQILSTPPKKHGKEKNVEVFWVQTAQEQLSITTQESQQLLVYVQETRRQAAIAQEIIAFVGSLETDAIGVGGALFALGSLATLEFDSQSAAMPEVFIKKEGKTAINVEAIESIFQQVLEEQFMAVVDHEDQKEDEGGETLIQQQPDIVVATWMKEFIHTLDQKTPEEAIEIVEQEERVVVVKLEQLREAFQEFLNLQGETLEPRTVENEPLREFSFAVTLWMTLELFSYWRSLVALKEVLTGIRQKEALEGLVQREPTQWVLLAIIWYLAMIREQGMMQRQTPKQKKNKYKAHGVIFAYCS